MCLVSGSEEDGVVSVPSEGSVSPSVSSIVDMVRTGMGGGGRGAIGGDTTGSEGAVIPVYLGVLSRAILVTVLLIVTVLLLENLSG